MRVAVKLHRCSTRWKAGPCWRVQKALDEQAINYEIVKRVAAKRLRACALLRRSTNTGKPLRCESL